MTYLTCLLVNLTELALDTTVRAVVFRLVCCPVCACLGVGGRKQDRLAPEAARVLEQNPGLLGTAQGPGVLPALQHLL